MVRVICSQVVPIVLLILFLHKNVKLENSFGRSVASMRPAMKFRDFFNFMVDSRNNHAFPNPWSMTRIDHKVSKFLWLKIVFRATRYI